MTMQNLSSYGWLKKTIALLVISSFTLSGVAFGETTNTDTIKPVEQAQVTTDPSKIVIPRDYGLIKSRYAAGDSKKLVVHIQDAHCNYEAQSNIIRIIECLIKNDGLNLISVEGADGFIDTSWFKAFPDADIRKEVADYFMKKGEITGPEFLSITSDYPIKLFGAETRAYYIENLNAFTSSYPLKEDTEKYFNQIKTVINKLKGYIYSEELKEFDAKSQAYETKKVTFTDYIKYLESLSAQYKLNMRQYSNLFKLVSVLVYEKKINFNIVDKERSTLIDMITKKLDKEQLTELVNRSLEFKMGKISSAEYYNYLKVLASKYGIALSSDYPNLFNYIIYNSVYSRIENESLFKDIKKFEEALREKLFANDDQRTLDRLSRHVNVLLGLVNIKLLNDDFDYYKTHKEEFAYEVFADFINKMALRYGFAYEVDAPTEAVKESMPKLEDFYAIAIKRDKALVDNTVQAMNKEGVSVSVLVTGGFHSEGIAKLLEKQNISYVVVCPNITKDVETPYVKILTNQRTPLEDILSDTTAATADANPSQGNMLAPYLMTAAIPRIGMLRSISTKEISDRARQDMHLWAKISISRWLPAARAALAKRMDKEPNQKMMEAQFRIDAKTSIEIYVEAKNKVLKSAGFKELSHDEIAALMKAAAIIAEDIAPAIIAELMKSQAPKAIARGEAYSSPGTFTSYTRQNMAELINAIPELEKLMNEYRAMAKGEVRNALGKEIDKLIKLRYNFKIAERSVGASLKGVSEANVVKNIPTLPDFIKSPEYLKYIAKARELRFGSGRARIDVWGGAASRLFGEGQERDTSLSYAAHDIYDVAVSHGFDKKQLEANGAIFGLSIATRAMIQKFLNTEEEIRRYYKGLGINKSDEEIEREREQIVRMTPRIVIINDESGRSIVNEFLKNDFYMATPELVVFVVQSAYYGWEIVNGKPVLNTSTALTPGGHGDATMQVVQNGRAFTVDKTGHVNVLKEDAVTYLMSKTNNAIKVFIQSRVNDMTKLGASAVDHTELTVNEIDMGIFALALANMGDLENLNDGCNVIMEQVGQDHNNPIKGGSPLSVAGKKFLVEGLAQSDTITKLVAKEGVPFNRFFIFHKPLALTKILKPKGLPVYFRFRDGYIYPETVTGDITMLDGMNAGYVLEPGRQINDYKDTKGLQNGVSAAQFQDKDQKFRQYTAMFSKIRDNNAEKGVALSEAEAVKAPGLGKSGVGELAALKSAGVGAESAQGNITVMNLPLNKAQKAEINSAIRSDFENDRAKLIISIFGPVELYVYVIPSLEKYDYLIAHPGRGGEALQHSKMRIYFSPSRAVWYNNLPENLKKEFLKHEIDHLVNPFDDEASVQARAPIGNIIRYVNDHEASQKMGNVSIRYILDNPQSSFNIPVSAIMRQYRSNVEWAIDRMRKSTAGTRGVLDTDDILGGPQLNAAVVTLMAQGYANYINNNFPREERGAFIGFDPRYFSKEFAQIFTRVLLANGIKVYRDINEMPTATPLTSYMAYFFNVACGIEITSSHNPPNQNGIKSQTIYGGVDTDAISAKIAKEVQKLYDAGMAGKGVIKVAPYDLSRIDIVNAKEIYLDNYLKRIFTEDYVVMMKKAMDNDAKFLFDGLYGIGGATIEYYLDKLFSGYDWRSKIIIMNDKMDPAIGGIKRPDPSRPETLELSGALEKLATTPAVLVSVTADMDADRIGTGVIIPEKDVARAKKYGLFVSQMKFGGKVVNIVRFTPNQIFTMIAYDKALEAYQEAIGTRDLAAIDKAHEDKIPNLYLLTSIPSSLIAKAMIERLRGTAVLTTVGFKNLGDQARQLDSKRNVKDATIVALMEESGGANVGPVRAADKRDSRGTSIHRDKDTISLALSLYGSAARLSLEGKNLLDEYIEMAQNLGGLFYYDRLDAYLPDQESAENLDPVEAQKADAVKQEIIKRFRAIDHVIEPGKAVSNLDDGNNMATLIGLFGKSPSDIKDTAEFTVPNTVLLVENDKTHEWEYISPKAKRIEFKDGESIEVFHTGRSDQEGPSITLYGRDGKMKARTLIRPSGTESLIRVYMEIFEPQNNPEPEHIYRYFIPLLRYLGLDQYSLKQGGPNYVDDYVASIDKKYDIKASALSGVKESAQILDKKLHTPLAAASADMAARFMQGGYNQIGYGVPVGASIDGSFAIDGEGNQGYYVNGGKKVFTDTVEAMKKFFANRAAILGKPIRYVIKPGIGGQHTPFQGIADLFRILDARSGRIVGEYELGKDYESSISSVLKELGAGWDQIAVMPSSKSGSTDETMMIFTEIFRALLKNIAIKEGLNGELFAGAVLNTMHEVNFVNGKERAAGDLFKGFNLALVRQDLSKAGLTVSYEQVNKIFGIALGNMFFETTDRPEQSRLSAFIRNSGLDKELGENAPGFGAMFDNVGGRWTADLHMMTFLAYHKLDAEEYWRTRYAGIKDVRAGTHIANRLAEKILNEKITDIALIVPDELFWFGKAMEQNFNESIWQKGFANLIAIRAGDWESQSKHYESNPARLVINISKLRASAVPAGKFNLINVPTPDLAASLNKQASANSLGELFTTFYGMTHTVGNALIVRALAEKGYSAADVDLNDLNNPATKIVQQNLYVRQPYVELGKGLLEKKLKALQVEGLRAIEEEFERIKTAAREAQLISNIGELDLPAKANNAAPLASAIDRAAKYALKTDRKFVPLIYLEGGKFIELREYLVKLGIEWVMQGTGDQHISYQQVLAQPQKYLPLIVSFVPEQVTPGRPAVGFAKGYLDNVSPNMVRDLFAEASYKALTEPRKNEAGEDVTGAAGVFLRITDSEENRAIFAASFDAAKKERGIKPTAVFDHTIESIMQSSNTGECARKAAENLFKAEEAKISIKKHLILVKSAIPSEQLATTTAINYANYCADYYNEMEGYTADIVDTYGEAVILLAKNPDWDKTNTIVGLIDRQALDRMAAELEKNGMQGKTKLLPMERFDKDQFVPLKGFFDLMSVLVHVNRPLDKPEDQELRDAIKDLLNEIGVRDVEDLINALSIAAYFEDPIKLAKNFIIRLLPPTKAVDQMELRDRYNAAKKVVESL